jgi:hypothetical protein
MIIDIIIVEHLLLSRPRSNHPAVDQLEFGF